MLQVQQGTGELNDVSEDSEDLDAFEDLDGDDMDGESGKYSFKISKPKVPVPHKMPVIIGSYREEKDLLNSMDGLGHAVIIWRGKFKVPQSTISGFDGCKKGHPLVTLFGQVLDAIAKDDDLDENKVAAVGFSATSKATMMFACYSDRMTGIYASCSGFEAIDPGDGCNMKNLAAACNSVNIKRAKVRPPPGKCKACQKAVLENCEVTKQCEIKGAYPCHIKKPFIILSQTGINDYFKYESELLFDAAKAEGIDARWQEWQMGHKRPQEIGAIIMSSFGFGEYCPDKCEKAVIECAQQSDWKGLDWCLSFESPHRVKECPKFCVPTKALLFENILDKVLIEHKGNYGPAQASQDRPATSKCSFDEYKK
jgi:hypothetical protein